jgi:hypothetical protein
MGCCWQTTYCTLPTELVSKVLGEVVEGYMPDITKYADGDWYQYV